MFISAFSGPGVSRKGSTANTVPVRTQRHQTIKEGLDLPHLTLTCRNKSILRHKKIGEELVLSARISSGLVRSGGRAVLRGTAQRRKGKEEDDLGWLQHTLMHPDVLLGPAGKV